MHGVRDNILNEQAKALGLPLYRIALPQECNNSIYEKSMYTFLEQTQRKGVNYLAFGDLFLPDIRAYREKQLVAYSIQPIFPLWQRDTTELSISMISSGLKALIACVDTYKLPAEFVGREYDRDFLMDLSAGVDPCGENGEFHTCVYDAPFFAKPISITTGKRHYSGQFCFIDLSLE